jgi:hypothetical protein
MATDALGFVECEKRAGKRIARSIRSIVKVSLLAAMKPKRGRFGRASADWATTRLPQLPTDVVFEILSWLPVESLCRSWCVCTSWRALISEPAFVAAHRSRAGDQPILVAATTSTLQIMDAEGAVARLVDLGGPCKLRASLDRLVLSPIDDSSAAIRVVDLAGGGTVTTHHEPPEACRPLHQMVRLRSRRPVRRAQARLHQRCDPLLPCDLRGPHSRRWWLWVEPAAFRPKNG